MGSQNRSEQQLILLMATKRVIRPAKAAPPVGPYSHGVRVGDLLFCSGQIPIDPANPSAAIAGDIRAQTQRVLQNVKVILDDQGLSFGNVVKSTVFLTNLADFAAMNEVYAEFFGNEKPARTTVEARFVAPMRVEIDAIAYKPLP